MKPKNQDRDIFNPAYALIVAHKIDMKSVPGKILMGIMIGLPMTGFLLFEMTGMVTISAAMLYILLILANDQLRKRMVE